MVILSAYDWICISVLFVVWMKGPVQGASGIWVMLYLSIFLCGSSHYLILPPEKALAPHSYTLAWKIPWTEEPGRLQSMRSLRAGHD